MVLIKKYRLLDKIGSGSFGSIYSCTPLLKLGEHVDNKRKFAVKLVRIITSRKRKARATDNSSTKSSSTSSSRASVPH